MRDSRIYRPQLPTVTEVRSMVAATNETSCACTVYNVLPFTPFILSAYYNSRMYPEGYVSSTLLYFFSL